MSNDQARRTDSAGRAGRGGELDAVVVGAGFSGIYMLERLRRMGLSVLVLEAGTDVGGTWYWNRYPGARSDSDSMVYCLSDRFSEELLKEWEWSERYPSQPEIQSYLRWVVDKLDLRRHMEFGTRVVSASYVDSRHVWEVSTDAGTHVTARFFIPAVGALSHPVVPDLPGIDTFQGQWYHSARLPVEGVDFAGKRVAVIGNGATAVQIVPEVAKEASEVWEFVRHPYHCLPARNHQLDEDDWREIHAHHEEIWEQARQNFLGFPYRDFLGMASDFSAEQQQQILEECWMTGGFPFGLCTFADVLTDRKTNDIFMSFMKEKIGQIIHDPGRAAMVTPQDPFASKRPPLENGYYAAFNRDNVHVVDMKLSPITEITSSGIRTREREYEVDIILLATGFDAFTGSLLNMGIVGRGGLTLSEKWAGGPRDYLGLMVHGFPNMFMLYCGPFNPAILMNAPTLIEQQGEWISGCIEHLRAGGCQYIEPQQEAEDQFVALHEAVASATLIPETSSWWTGTNVEGKAHGLLSWCGGFPEYRRMCDEAASTGYSTFAVGAG